MDLFKDPFFIGFNDMFDRLNSVHTLATNQSYPPYDVQQIDDNEYIISLAVAGFSKEDISVSVDNGTLVIKGERDIEDVPKRVIHKGIAARKFTRTFALGEYMEVSSAALENGLLNIHVERILPEEKKPKTIKIK
ncbi:MAG: Hsp20 family protein [Minisyncoccia bacterium]